MSDNQSPFQGLETDPCQTKPKPPEKDKICPTCIPDPSFIVPTWWETTEPYLNKKDCVYEVAITINDFGESYSTDMVENSPYSSEDPDDPFSTLRRTYIQTGIRKMLRHFGKRESDEIICATFVSYEPEAVEDDKRWNWIVGATEVVMEGLTFGAYDSGTDVARCGSLYDMPKHELDSYINTISYVADLNTETKFDKHTINSSLRSAKNKITNPQALEVYARADEHWFTGPHGLFIVKVTVPAYIFDMVPPAPEIPEPDTGTAEVIFDAQDFVTKIMEIEAATKIHAKYQAYFYEFENGRLYQKIDLPAPSATQTIEGTGPAAGNPFEIDTSAHVGDTEVPTEVEGEVEAGFSEQSPNSTLEPFYLTFYKDRFQKFLRSLKKLIEIKPEGVENFKFNNARAKQTWDKPSEEQQPENEQQLDGPQDDTDEYEPQWGGAFYSIDIGDELNGWFTQTSRVDEIKITFDKEDELRPYVIKSIHARLKNCDWEKVVEGFDNFKTKWSEDQTLMGYIANLENISNELRAKVSPNWLDFTLKYTYPQLSVNYGSHDRFTDRTALNCIMEDFSKLDDWILSESIKFADAFAYRLNQNNCKILNATGSSPPTLEWDKDNWVGMAEYADKTWKAAKTRAWDDESTTVGAIKEYGKTVKDQWNLVGEKAILDQFNPCNWSKITTTAMRCLMNGLELDVAYKAIIKQTLISGGNELLEIFIKALPADKQAEIRALVEAEFGAMPWPWEEGWDPGDNSAALEKYSRDRLNDRIESEENFALIIKNFNTKGFLSFMTAVYTYFESTFESYGLVETPIAARNRLSTGFWNPYRENILTSLSALESSLLSAATEAGTIYASNASYVDNSRKELTAMREYFLTIGHKSTTAAPESLPSGATPERAVPFALWNTWSAGSWNPIKRAVPLSIGPSTPIDPNSSSSTSDSAQQAILKFPFEELSQKITTFTKDFESRITAWKAQKTDEIMSNFLNLIIDPGLKSKIKEAIDKHLKEVGDFMDAHLKLFVEGTTNNREVYEIASTSGLAGTLGITVGANFLKTEDTNPLYKALATVYKSAREQLIEGYSKLYVDPDVPTSGKPNTVKGRSELTAQDRILTGQQGLTLEEDDTGRLTDEQFKSRYNMGIVEYMEKKIPKELTYAAFYRLDTDIDLKSDMNPAELVSAEGGSLLQGGLAVNAAIVQGDNWHREFYAAMEPLLGKSLKENQDAAEAIKNKEESELYRQSEEELYEGTGVTAGSVQSSDTGGVVRFDQPSAGKTVNLYPNAGNIGLTTVSAPVVEVKGWKYETLRAQDNYQTIAQRIVGDKGAEKIPEVQDYLQKCNFQLYQKWGHTKGGWDRHGNWGKGASNDISLGKAAGILIAVPNSLDSFYTGVFDIMEEELESGGKIVQQYAAQQNEAEKKEKAEASLEFDKKVKEGQVPGIQWEQWKNMSADEKEKFLSQLNDKTFFIKGSSDPNAKYKVGTFGSALGKVQKAVIHAYIEAILEVSSMQEAMSAFDRLPGVDIFKLWFSTMDCPKRHWIEPPIDSFLESYSFDMCGVENPLKPKQSLVIPWDKSFPEIFTWNWFKAMSDAFLYSLRQLTNNFLKTILIKMAEIVDAALCKGLATLGDGFKSWITQDGRSWADVVDDVFCGENAFNPEEKERLSESIVEAALPASNSTSAATPASTDTTQTTAGGEVATADDGDEFVDENPLPPVTKGLNDPPVEGETKAMSFGSEPKEMSPKSTYSKIANTLSYVATADEIKKAMTSTEEEQDYTFLKNMSNILTAAVPEMAGSYNTPQKVMTFFMAAGNLMSSEQRAQVKESLNKEIDDFPLETSICLTKPQKALWDETRKEIFENAGLSPQSAADFVKAQDDKVVSDLSDMVDFYNAGIEGKFGDVLDQALGQGPLQDPDCKEAKANIVPNPKQAEADNKLVTSGMFARLEKSFIDDLVESNNLLGGIDQMLDGLTDRPGILNLILSDKAGYLLSTHNWIANFAILSLWGLIDVTPELPETVALHLRDELIRVGKNPYNPTVNYSDEWNFELDWEGRAEGTWWEALSNWIEAVLVTNNLKFRDISTIESDNFYGYDLKIPEHEPFSINKIIEDDMRQIVDSYESPDGEVIYGLDQLGASTPHRPHILNNFIVNTWSKALSEFENSEPLLSSMNADLNFSKSIILGMNRKMFDELIKALLTSDSPDGISQGFKFGSKLTELTPDDFIYVNPESGSVEYTYEEGDKVLGKSLTDNPRVKFLDPSVHGGSYEKPFLYISPPKHDGWMNMSQMFISNVDGCTDVAYNSLNLPDVLDKISRAKSQAKDHESLDQSPDCVIELPFDKIATAETLSQLEGVIVSTIRIYLTEYLITTLPIYSNVRLTPNNYGDGVLEYVSKKMKSGLNGQTTWLATTYEGHTYWLLFLEQVAQAVKRKVDAGDIEMTPDIEEAFGAINRAQEQHKHISWWDLWSGSGGVDVGDFMGALDENSTFDSIIQSKGADITITETIMLGSLFIAYGASATAVVASLLVAGPVFFVGSLFSLERARFASKIFTIKKVEQECMTLLKYLIKEEMSTYEKHIEDTLPERPYVYDVKKYLIGASKLAVGETTNSGIYDIELPVGGTSEETNIIPSFGTVNHCSKDGLTHPLNEVVLKDGKVTLANLRLDGGFYLEKYLRISDKTTVVMDVDQGGSEKVPDPSVPDWVVNRSDHLFGVVNILEFKQFLSDNADNFTIDTNISDLFGNARLMDDAGSEYAASLGIKFGVRLCLIPAKRPSWAEDDSELEDEYLGQLREYFKKEKSYFLENSPSLEGERLLQAKYSFPIASYEQDIADSKIFTLVESDDDLNQSLKCYIDRLTETKEFRYFFDYILNVEKIPSIMSIYSDSNFVKSLGLADGERNDPDDEDVLPKTNETEYLFNDSKEEARSLFVSNYKRRDFDPPEEDEEQGFFANRTKAMISNLWANISGGELPWWIKSRIRDSRPVDEEGKQCGNFFASQFQLKEKK